VKKQYLGFKSGVQLDQIGDEGSKGKKDPKHRVSSRDGSAQARESGPGGIFGKDSAASRRPIMIGRC
jgi:hypothetical protein